MKYYISVNNENEILVNNKTLHPSHWKSSEIRSILEDSGLSSNGSLKVLLKRLYNSIENEIESQEKEAEKSIKESEMIQKAVNVSLCINEYVSQNALSMCEFIDAISIIDFIDLHE